MSHFLTFFRLPGQYIGEKIDNIWKPRSQLQKSTDTGPLSEKEGSLSPGCSDNKTSQFKLRRAGKSDETSSSVRHVDEIDAVLRNPDVTVNSFKDIIQKYFVRKLENDGSSSRDSDTPMPPRRKAFEEETGTSAIPWVPTRQEVAQQGIESIVSTISMLQENQALLAAGPKEIPANKDVIASFITALQENQTLSKSEKTEIVRHLIQHLPKLSSLLPSSNSSEQKDNFVLPVLQQLRQMMEPDHKWTDMLGMEGTISLLPDMVNALTEINKFAPLPPARHFEDARSPQKCSVNEGTKILANILGSISLGFASKEKQSHLSRLVIDPVKRRQKEDPSSENIPLREQFLNSSKDVVLSLFKLLPEKPDPDRDSWRYPTRIGEVWLDKLVAHSPQALLGAPKAPYKSLIDLYGDPTNINSPNYKRNASWGDYPDAQIRDALRWFAQEQHYFPTPAQLVHKAGLIEQYTKLY